MKRYHIGRMLRNVWADSKHTWAYKRGIIERIGYTIDVVRIDARCYGWRHVLIGTRMNVKN